MSAQWTPPIGWTLREQAAHILHRIDEAGTIAVAARYSACVAYILHNADHAYTGRPNDTQLARLRRVLERSCTGESEAESRSRPNLERLLQERN